MCVYLHIAVLLPCGVPGEAHGVGLHVGDGELAHAHRRAQHGALQRAAAGHGLVLRKVARGLATRPLSIGPYVTNI